MTAIITGNDLGLTNNPLTPRGDANVGRSGQSDQVYLNSATGNLVIQARDEYIASLGTDLSLIRTYNSLGQFTDDNGDNWRLGVHQKVYGQTGTVNTTGSTVRKTFGDGADVLFTYDTTRSLYVSTASDGAHDTLSFNTSTNEWSWTNGTPGVEERYNGSGQLTSVRDTDGNVSTYAYTGTLLTQITDASGQTTSFSYTGNNLTQISVASAGQTQTLTRYTYDASNRLTQVKVDLSPEDNSITDGKVYTTTYTYDGTSTSKRVASITAGDGATISFTYDAQQRIATYTDGEGKVTTLSYTATTQNVPATATATSLTTPTISWATAALRETVPTNSAISPQVAFDQNGNGLGVWAIGADLYYSVYTKNTNGWSSPLTLDGTLANNPTTPHLSMSANGTALLTWMQGNNIYARRYVNSAWDGAATPIPIENNTAIALDPIGAINDLGNAIVVFRQPASGTTTPNNLVAARFVSGAWQMAGLSTGIVDNLATDITTPASLAIDTQGNATALWLQKAASGDANAKIYLSRYTWSSNSWSAPVNNKLQTNTTANVLAPKITFDGNGNGVAIWIQAGALLASSYTKSNNTWAAAVTLAASGVTTLHLSMSTNGNALATWIQSNNVQARRYSAGAWIGSAAELAENSTAAGANPIGSINNAGQAVIVFTQNDGAGVNSVFANRTNANAAFVATGALVIESSANVIATAMVPSVAIDTQGNINALWLQKNANESNDSVFGNRYNNDPTPYYLVQATDTWTTIAQTVYGDAQAASALQAAMGTPPPTLVQNLRLNVPATLNYTKTVVTGTQTDVTPSLGSAFTTSYFTDTQGRITETRTPAVGGVRFSTLYSYDAQSNLIGITDRNGNATTLDYDTRGNLSRRRDALGNTVEYTYSTATPTNIDNEVLTETVYLTPDPDGAGNLPPTNPLTTHYVYNGKGRLRFVVSGDGRVTEHRYDPVITVNRVATILYTSARYALTDFSETGLQNWVNGLAGADRAKTERVDYAYDARGNLTKTTAYTQTDTGGVGVPATATTTQFVYDQRGRLLQTLDARGSAGTPNATNPNLPYATTYVYDGLGRVLSTTQWIDATTTRTALSAYDDANRKTTITLANGLATTSVYDRRGLLVSVSQTDNRGDSNPANDIALGTTIYQYDADGRLRIVTDPIGNKTHALYDEADRPVATIDATGVIVETVYDKVGNAVKQIGYAQPLSTTQTAALTDASGNPANVALSTLLSAAQQSDANNRITRYVYDSANRLALIVDPSDTDITQGYVTKSFYDGVGRVTDVIRYATAIAATGAIPANLNVPASSVDRQTRNFYDADGKLRGTLDGEGVFCEYEYDAAGQLTHVVHRGNPAAANLRATGTFDQLKTSVGTNATDDQHTYTFYDAKGQIIALLNAENYLTEYGYDAAGNKTAETRYYRTALTPYTGTQTVAQLRPSRDANDCFKVYTYDGSGALTQSSERYTNPTTGALLSETVTTYGYNSVGQLVKTTKALGAPEARAVQVRYDAQGRVTRELTAEGSAQVDAFIAQNPGATPAQIDAVWSQWGLFHTDNTAGRRVTTTDQNGFKTLFYYDADGRLTHTVNALGEVTETQYNAFGQVKETIRYTARINSTDLSTLTGGTVTPAFATLVAGLTNASSDARKQISYTVRGAVKDAIEWETATLSNTTHYSYNPFGNLMTLDRPALASTSYQYDKRGLLLQTTQGARVIAAKYDAFGRVTQTVDGNGNPPTTYVYDKLGRQLSVTAPLNRAHVMTYDAFGRVLTQTDALGNQTTYSYDDANRSFTIKTVLGNSLGFQTVTTTNRYGETVSFTDANGKITKYDYDKNGNLTRTTVDSATGGLNLKTERDYDRANLKIETRDANQVRTTYQYDAANRLLTKTIDPDPNHLAIQTTYVYDGGGRTLTITEAAGSPEARLTTYSYDRKGQTLSVVDALNIATIYTYDAQGKTLTVTEASGTSDARTTQYVYDTLGRRSQEIKDPGTGGLDLTTTYAYDNNDNLVTKTEAPGKAEERNTRYYYDAGDRLVYVLDPANGLRRNDYDADDRVIATTAYAAAAQGLSTNPTTAEIQSYISTHADAAHDRTTRHVYDQDGREVFTVDSLWSVTKQIYDPAGNVVERIVYGRAIPNTTPLTVAGVTGAIGALDATVDRSTKTVYDAANRPVFMVDALWQVTKLTYDANGNVLERLIYKDPIPSTTALTLTGVGNALPASPDMTVNERARTVYDAANRAVYAIDAAGFVTQNVYNRFGEVIRNVEYANNITVGGQLTADAIANFFSTNRDPAHDRSVRNVFDAVGRVKYTIDAAGYVKETQYDNLGQVTAVVDHGQPIYVGDTPSLAEVAAAFNPDTVSATVSNTQSNYLQDAGVQPYPYLASARQDVSTPVAAGVPATNTASGSDPVQPYPYATSANLDTAAAATQAVTVSNQISAVPADPPLQPYIYVASAKQDTAGTVTQNVTLTTVNQSIGQSGNVVDYAWYRSGGTLVAGAGQSIVAGYVGSGDTTPTQVKATIYLNSSYYTTTYTDVAYSQLQSWSNEAGESGYFNHWYGVNNWNGQVNLTTGSLPAGAYTVVIETRDDYVPQVFTGEDGQEVPVYSDVDDDGSWSYSNTINVNVGTVVQPTIVSWELSTQPAGTTTSFQYRPAGSGSSYTSVSVGTSGSNQQVNLGAISAGNYEYLISYTDSYGRIVKAASGTLTSSFGTTTSTAATFSYTQVTSTAVAGSSISGYIAASDVPAIDYVDATVMDHITGALVSAARTYPEFEASYNGNVNLKVGSALANGSYTVAIVIHWKNGTVTNKPTFTYEIGLQSFIRDTLSWAASTQPAGATVSFAYRASGSSGAYTNVGVTTNGSNQQVVIDRLPSGNYDYQINYADSYGRILKSAASTFTVSSTVGTTNTSVNFNYTQVTSTPGAGSSITGYIPLADVPTIDKVQAVVKDVNGNGVSTAWTYPEFEASYNGRVNLKTGAVLADGHYTVAVTIFYKNGTTVNKPVFDYEIGQQFVHAPAQPYAYITSAKQDTPGPATQNVAFTIVNTSIGQSSNVVNYAWYRSGGTLVTGAGFSIVPGYVSFGDTTPTQVKATVYLNGSYYTTTYTDVAYYQVQPWSNEAGESGYINHWFGVSNWNGQVNLTTGSLPAGAYTVVLETRDDYIPETYTGEDGHEVPDRADFDDDGSWSYSSTTNIVVDAVLQPTFVSWAASTQPAGTTTTFQYRHVGSSGAYTSAAVGTSGSNQQVNLGAIAAGNYEYIVQYTDAYGRIVKSASGAFASSVGATTSATAVFNYTQITSTTVAGSSISDYIAASDVSAIDYVDATVTDRLTGVLISTARTYPEGEADYSGNVNFKLGSALANGSYNVAIIVHRKNGTVENKPTFIYELGVQTYVRDTLSWAASTQPSSTTTSFGYRPSGSSGVYLAVPVTTAGSNQQVVIDRLLPGNYDYQINYTDSFGRIVKSASGTLTAAGAAGTANITLPLSFNNVTSTAATGSSITSYIALADVPAIDRVQAVVKNSAGAVISTALTDPEFEPNYNGNVNLSVGSVLADGRYFVTITVYYKNGTITTKPTFEYQIGKQIDRDPAQPYPYVVSARSDIASAATQNVTLQAVNISVTQSPSVVNYAWYRNGDTLVTGQGWSIIPGYVGFGDRTPTQVKATIYRNNALFATTYTDVGHAELGNTLDGLPITRWFGVDNWNGQVNLTTDTLLPGTYTVVLETRDDAVESRPDEAGDEAGLIPVDGDGTWVYSSTITINIGTQANVTHVDWDASTQPPGTTATFQYRSSGSGAAYTPVATQRVGGALRADVGVVQDGSYDYLIEYRDDFDRVVKSASGTFVSTTGQTTSSNAVFNYSAITSTPTAGSSIRTYFDYLSAEDRAKIDYAEATVVDRATGLTVSTAKTYPNDEGASYAGELNLKVGSPLGTGSYSISVVIHRRDGSTEERPNFIYEIGLQQNIHRNTTVSWSTANQPANSYVKFAYALLNSASFVDAPVIIGSGQDRVELLDIVVGDYQYFVRYYENTTNQLLKEARGQFTATATPPNPQPGPATLLFQPDLNNVSPDRANSFTYDKAGRLALSVDGKQKSEQYFYNAVGDKTSLVNRSENHDTWTYQYDKAGRVTAEVTPIVAVTNFALDESGTQIFFDASGRPIPSTNQQKVVTVMTYDALGNVKTRTEGILRNATGPDDTSLARTTQYDYDALGRQVKTTFPQTRAYNTADDLTTNGINGTVSRTETTPVTPVSRIFYNPLGNAVASVDAAGNYSYRVYDSLNRVRYQIDAERYVTEHQYDRFGNEAKTIRYADRINTAVHGDPTLGFSLGELPGLLGASAPNRTLETRYNVLNQATDIIEPQTFVYDSSTSDTNQQYSTAAGAVTKNYYNAFGQVIKQRLLRNDKTTTWDDTYFYYDKRGNKVAQVDKFGYLTTWTYDGENNLTREIEYAEALTAGSWNPNSFGTPKISTPQTAPDNANGYDRETRFGYDGKNQKVSETKVNVEFANRTGNLSVARAYGDVVTQYAYDNVGNVVRTTSVNDINDPNDDVTTYVYYDALGRSSAIVNPAGMNALGLTKMEYNAYGNVVHQTRYASGVADPTAYTSPATSPDDQQSYTLYDAHSHIIQTVDAERRSMFFSYDVMGRMAKQWQPITDVDGKVQNAVKVFKYDALGRQTQTIEPSYLPNRNAVQSGPPLDIAPLALDYTIVAHPPSGDEGGYDTIDVSWTAMDGWGIGDVKIEADVTTNSGNATVSHTLSYNDGNSWSLTSTDSGQPPLEPFVPPGLINSVNAARLYKKDASGNWKLVQSRTSSGAYANVIDGATLLHAGDQATFRYRPVSGGTWNTLPLVFMDDKYAFSTEGLAAGSYYLDVLYSAPNETVSPYHVTGQFSVNGASGSLSTFETNVSSYSPPALNPADFATSQVQYNAYGEITDKGVNGYQEHFSYDDAGHLWKSNSGDGMYKVFLYDLEDHVTAKIASQQLDFGSSVYANPAAVANADPANVMRTDIVFKRGENVVIERQPTLSIEQALDVSTAPLAFPSAYLTFSVLSSAQVGDEGGYGWYGDNAVILGWNAMAAWGNGDVRVDLDYRSGLYPIYDGLGGVSTGGGFAKTISKTFASAEADAGVTLTWSDFSVALDDGGISAITGVRVYKKDLSGNWVLVHNRATSGTYSNQMVIPTPTELGGSVDLAATRVDGSGTANPKVYNFGSKMLADLSGLDPGAYTYEVFYHHKNARSDAAEPKAYAHASGTFTLNGGSGAFTQATPAVSDPLRLKPAVTQTLDRWGNVLRASNPGNAIAETAYRYNYANQVLSEIKPRTTVFGIDGTEIQGFAPISYNYYDKLGHTIGTLDANSVGQTDVATTYVYNTAGQLTAEYHLDGGIVQYTYDKLGRRVTMRDANNNTTTYVYDHLNRLTSEQRPIGADDYTYDEVGNRIRHRNANGEFDYTWYDTRGKVIRTRENMGQEINTFYDVWGNKRKEVNPNGDVVTLSYNIGDSGYFHRLNSRVDLRGDTHTYSYDGNFAGLLTHETSTRNQNIAYAYYENGTLKRITDVALNAETFYEYDTAGNRTRERFTKDTFIQQDNRMKYDDLGWLLSVQDNRYSLTYGYDANGNRRFAISNYFDVEGNPQDRRNWYLYDRMNRLTLSDGVRGNSGILIVIPAIGVIAPPGLRPLLQGNGANATHVATGQGVQITYDKAGNRVGAFYYGKDNDVPVATNERYEYDANNRLTKTYVDEVLDSSRTYDSVGRVTDQVSNARLDYVHTTSVYDSNGRLMQQNNFKRNSAQQPEFLQSQVLYTHFDHAGNLITYQSTVYPSFTYTNFYRLSYEKYDVYKQGTTSGTSTHFDPGATTNQYDRNGNLIAFDDQFGTDRHRTFVNDQFGHILNKTENGKTAYYFYVNGNPAGSTIAKDNSDFDFNYTPVSDKYPLTSPNSYVVTQDGESLRAIASLVYGDAKLWYLIADANGLQTDTATKAGQRLVIPNKITNIYNDNTTHKIYNPADLIGNTTPTLPAPPPPPGPDCAETLIMIIMIIIIIIVSEGSAAPEAEGMMTAEEINLVGDIALPVASTEVSIPAVMATAAATNAATQLVMMALGYQDKFSWSSLAISVVSAGIGGAISNGLELEVGGVGRAIVGNIVGQVINVAAGQQQKFSWQSLAVSAISAPITRSIDDRFKGIQDPFARSITTGFLGNVARQGVSMLVNGGGKINWASIAADTFGNALGSSIVEEITKSEGEKRAAAERQRVEVEQLFQQYPPSTGFVSGTGGYGGEDTPIDPSTSDLPNTQGAGKAASYTVGNKDTVEAIARRLYGDDWRAGVAIIVNENNLRMNDLGSPLIRAGQDLLTPGLDGYDIDVENRNGGRIVSDNRAAIDARNAAQLEAAQRAAAAQASAESSIDFASITRRLMPYPGGEFSTPTEQQLQMTHFDSYDGTSTSGSIAKFLKSTENVALETGEAAKIAEKTGESLEGSAKILGYKRAATFLTSVGKYVGWVGTASTAVEETAYVARTGLENGASTAALAVGASVTNVAGDVAFTAGGAEFGLFVGLALAPVTFGLSVPILTAAFGYGGHFVWDRYYKDHVREGWTGIPQHSEE